MKITTPQRVAHTYTQRLSGTPADVFPLLCPVRECDWVNGWDPRLVITSSGAAERDCIFFTGPQDNEAIWLVTEYEPPKRIEFIKVNPRETAARITIHLRADGDATLAEITYAYTALTALGENVVTEFTPAYYQSFMQAWEDQLNHYLRTGTKLPAPR